MIAAAIPMAVQYRWLKSPRWLAVFQPLLRRHQTVEQSMAAPKARSHYTMNSYCLFPSLVVRHSRDNLHSLLALGVSK